MLVHCGKRADKGTHMKGLVFVFCFRILFSCFRSSFICPRFSPTVVFHTTFREQQLSHPCVSRPHHPPMTASRAVGLHNTEKGHTQPSLTILGALYFDTFHLETSGCHSHFPLEGILNDGWSPTLRGSSVGRGRRRSRRVHGHTASLKKRGTIAKNPDLRRWSKQQLCL